MAVTMLFRCRISSAIATAAIADNALLPQLDDGFTSAEQHRPRPSAVADEDNALDVAVDDEDAAD